MMSKKDRIVVNKEKETRTKEISKMISEGGLGSDKYYEIKKERAAQEKADKKSNDT